MHIMDGPTWTLSCTIHFEQTVAFFRDSCGLPITDEGIPVTDTQFTRYAQFTLPTGGVLEIVEPTPAVAALYTAPIMSLTVDDLRRARHELEAQQISFVTSIFATPDGWGWTYFRAPDGNIYQLYGPYTE